MKIAYNNKDGAFHTERSLLLENVKLLQEEIKKCEENYYQKLKIIDDFWETQTKLQDFDKTIKEKNLSIHKGKHEIKQMKIAVEKKEESYSIEQIPHHFGDGPKTFGYSKKRKI